jgi:hypothetical protein
MEPLAARQALVLTYRQPVVRREMVLHHPPQSLTSARILLVVSVVAETSTSRAVALYHISHFPPYEWWERLEAIRVACSVSVALVHAYQVVRRLAARRPITALAALAAHRSMDLLPLPVVLAPLV